jgi:hypothetical protein
LPAIEGDRLKRRAAPTRLPLVAERQRNELGMTWDQIIVGARDNESSEIDDEDGNENYDDDEDDDGPDDDVV